MICVGPPLSPWFCVVCVSLSFVLPLSLIVGLHIGILRELRQLKKKEKKDNLPRKIIQIPKTKNDGGGVVGARVGDDGITCTGVSVDDDDVVVDTERCCGLCSRVRGSTGRLSVQGSTGTNVTYVPALTNGVSMSSDVTPVVSVYASPPSADELPFDDVCSNKLDLTLHRSRSNERIGSGGSSRKQKTNVQLLSLEVLQHTPSKANDTTVQTDDLGSGSTNASTTSLFNKKHKGTPPGKKKSPYLTHMRLWNSEQNLPDTAHLNVTPVNPLTRFRSVENVSSNISASRLDLSAMAGKPKRGGRGDRALRTVLCLVLCFVICWLPFFVVTVIYILTDVTIPDVVMNLVLWGGYANSTLNPLLLYCFNLAIRGAIRRFLRLKT
jgi:hypothetical protein